MKTLKLIALAAFALLFSQCKTTAPTAPTGPAPSLLEVTQILDSTQSKFLAFSAQNNGNPHLSIMQTASWVQSQPNVKSATALDSIYITIILKSGLRTTFFFDEVGTDSLSLFKGGGGSGSSKELAVSGSRILSKNTITNKKVLIYCAGCSEFYKHNEIQTTANILNGSSAGLDVTLLKDEECTYQMVDNFKDYGFVIIDTHGLPDAFMIGTKITIDNNTVSDDLFRTNIIAQGGQAMLDKLLSGELSFYDRVKGNILEPYWKHAYISNVYYLNLDVTSKYIDGLPPMPGTVIFGSMCYSGWDLPLGTAYTPIKTSFMNKNPISYYCFAFDNGTSATAGVPFAKAMEDSLSYELAHDLDSTKIANLMPDLQSEYSDPAFTTNKLNFKHFGADDYSYEKCNSIDSFIDARDGHKYKTVCIGDQTWMSENLKYVPFLGSVCYNNDSANCNTYGRLYTWVTVMAGYNPSDAVPSGVQGICPDGWHLPSQGEFTKLLAAVGGESVAGTALKSTSPLWGSPNTATNSSGFSALPAGENTIGTNFYNIGGEELFWSASEQQAGLYAWHLILYATFANASTSPSTEVAGYSCRCVKDK